MQILHFAHPVVTEHLFRALFPYVLGYIGSCPAQTWHVFVNVYLALHRMATLTHAAALVHLHDITYRCTCTRI